MATIHKLNPVAGVYEFPTLAVGFTRVTVYAKNPARVYYVTVPDISLAEVPIEYRAILYRAVDDLLAGALKRVLTTNPDATSCSDSLFTLEAISAAAGRERMTSARLLTLWRQSHKYVFTVAPQFTVLQGSALLRYKGRVDKVETLMKALTGRQPELQFTSVDLDSILVNLAPEDIDTEFGQYIAERCEAIREILPDFSKAL